MWRVIFDHFPSFLDRQKTRPIAISRMLRANSDGRTDRPTEGRTDKAIYKVACTQLKTRLTDGRLDRPPDNLYKHSLLKTAWMHLEIDVKRAPVMYVFADCSFEC